MSREKTGIDLLKNILILIIFVNTQLKILNKMLLQNYFFLFEKYISEFHAINIIYINDGNILLKSNLQNKYVCNIIRNFTCMSQYNKKNKYEAFARLTYILILLLKKPQIYDGKQI